MRENGWLENEFKAASKRVSEWPEWKKQIEARNLSLEGKEQESTLQDNPSKVPKESE